MIELIAGDGRELGGGERTSLQVVGLYTRAGRNLVVHVRAAWVEDAWTGRRLEIKDVVISGTPVHAEDLRLPLGRIERELRANPNLIRGAIEAQRDLLPPDDPLPEPIGRPR